MRTIFATTMMVLFIIFCLEFFLWLVDEMDDIGKGRYDVTHAIFYVLLQMPYQLYQLFPLTALMGSILGLGLLAGHSEIIVMRTCGITLYQIIWTVLKLGIAMGLVVMLLGESLAPVLVHHAENHKIRYTTDGQAMRSLKGIWLRDVDNYLYVQSFDGEKNLKHVTRYQFGSDKTLKMAAFAISGAIEEDVWQMSDVNITYVHDSVIESDEQAHMTWDIDIPTSVLNLVKITPEELTLKMLFEYILEQEENDTNAGLYAFMFWQRIFQPINTLIMMLLAVPFILGPLRDASMGLKLITGISTAFCFYILTKMFGPISTVYQMPAIIAAILPSTIFAFIGLYLIRRVG